MSPATSMRKHVLIGLTAVTLVALSILFAFALGRAREAAFSTSCVHNLKLLSLSLRMYAAEHKSQFPNKVSDLYPQYLTDARILVCPNLRAHNKKTLGTEYPFSDPPTTEEIDTLSSYVYIPGYNLDDDKDTVIACEKEDNHGGLGRALLYLDGRAFRVLPEDWPDPPSGE